MLELINPMLSGLGAGLVLAIMSGPVFFALLQTSIEKGFVAGVLFALGVVISDSMYFLIAYFGLSQIKLQGGSDIQEILGLVGGVIIIIFGIQLLRKRPQLNAQETPPTASRNSLMRSLGKAFLLNGLNPFVLFYWASIVGALGSEYHFDQKSIFAFFVMCMITVFGTDMLKAYLAQRLRALMTINFMLWLNRIAGGGLTLAGIVLLYRTAHMAGMI